MWMGYGYFWEKPEPCEATEDRKDVFLVDSSIPSSSWARLYVESKPKSPSMARMGDGYERERDDGRHEVWGDYPALLF